MLFDRIKICVDPKPPDLCLSSAARVAWFYVIQLARCLTGLKVNGRLRRELRHDWCLEMEPARHHIGNPGRAGPPDELEGKLRA